jgi:adenylate cyclase
LVEEKWNIDADVKEIFRQFQEAIWLYSKQNFQEALEIFQKLSELWDKPSTTYVERCEMYIKNPPGKDWDQIWTMQSK